MKQLPVNFSSTPVKTPEELEQARQKLEEAKKKVEELLSKLQTYAEQLENININASFGGQVKQQIVDGVVDPLLDGIGCFNFELELLQLNLLINLYALDIPIPTLPAIPEPLKILLGFDVNIPLEIPTVADFKQRINQKIEEQKRKCQQEIINKQLRGAQEEETPFIARQDSTNLSNQQNTARPVNSNESNCVATEIGSSLEEATNKGIFMLTRVLKCCGKTQATVLNSKQENGQFVVTVGII